MFLARFRTKILSWVITLCSAFSLE